jgi:hypothetical protein
MEEQITSYSAVKKQALKNKQALKKKQTIIAIVIVILIAAAAIIYSVIKANTHKAWLEYMDKYYYPFLEINNIEDNATIENYYTLEKDYHYNNRSVRLMTQRPRKDHFEFYAELSSQSCNSFNDDIWHVPFDDYDYRYWFTASVDRSGKWEYYFFLNNYNKGSQMSKDGFGCLITDDGYIREVKTEPLSDNERKVLNEFLPQIRDLQNEMRNNILKGLT